MAKSKKFYAVQCGREGPKVYDNWPQCKEAVTGWSGAKYKGFVTEEQAYAWINGDDTLGNATKYDTRNSWLNPPAPHTSNSNQTPLPETPPSVPLDVHKFTEDVISLPNSPEEANVLLRKSTNTLSEDHEHILGLVKQGINIFLTGAAGTGKSVLLRKIIDTFRRPVSQSLAITASTRIAARNIGGVTLHSWAGIGLGVVGVDKLIVKVENNEYIRQRWLRVRTLIIDEISMINGLLYDKLDRIARSIRRKNLPFGGIQLVVSGDFYQLPPIPDQHNPACFAFDSRSWARCFETPGIGTVYELTKVFRQRDEKLIDMLNGLRLRAPDPRIFTQFQELSRAIRYSDGLESCELIPSRKDVEEANETRLQRLPGMSQTFVASGISDCDMYAKTHFQRSFAPEITTLKVGAQVMLIKDLVQGELVHGSMGLVVEFKSLADASRLHTEIAEVKELEHRQQKYHEETPSVDREWPVVRFLNGRTLLFKPVEFEVFLNGRMRARRYQVPIILSWALLLHGSQGQTIERVTVDLGTVFDKGQVYMALSRATCLADLQVLNFDRSIVTPHPKVLEYYERMDANKTLRAPAATRAASAVRLWNPHDESDDEEASDWAVDLGSS